MLQENDSYIKCNKVDNPKEVISIPVPLYESIMGQYFVGQTDTLIVSNTKNAWASLVNPIGSRIDLYVNVFTISNFSDNNLVVEIWLNAKIQKKESISKKVSPTNTVLRPLPKNKAEIRFIESTTEIPKDGINVFKRIVPPNSTLVSEEDGKFIEAPGGNYTLIIKSSSFQPSNIICAFGWYERPRC